MEKVVYIVKNICHNLFSHLKTPDNFFIYIQQNICRSLYMVNFFRLRSLSYIFQVNVFGKAARGRDLIVHNQTSLFKFFDIDDLFGLSFLSFLL